MDLDLIHELSAAFALDALDAEGERFYTRHLAHCAQCQGDMVGFAATAAALASAAPPAELPSALRQRILDSVHAESVAQQQTWSRRRAPALAVAVAAVAAVVAGVTLWSAGSFGSHTSASSQSTLQLNGAEGAVVRSGNGEATMIVSHLHAAPSGKIYEAWVMRNGDALPAGTFRASAVTTVVHLSRQVPRGATVGVTIENGSGATRLTHTPLFTSAQA
jgi:anti-sigma-K factor RskA